MASAVHRANAAHFTNRFKLWLLSAPVQARGLKSYVMASACTAVVTVDSELTHAERCDEVIQHLWWLAAHFNSPELMHTNESVLAARTAELYHWREGHQCKPTWLSLGREVD